jgi:hypothetical protein
MCEGYALWHHAVNTSTPPLFLALNIFEIEKPQLDGRSPGFGVPYRFYVGIKTELFGFIEQNRAFDSLGEDLGPQHLNNVLIDDASVPGVQVPSGESRAYVDKSA